VSAAIRHYEDASSLKDSGRIDNAGHLVGFAAECAIKFQIRSLRTGEDTLHTHLPGLLAAARVHLGPRAGYTGMYDIIKGDVFRGWNVSKRYLPTGHTSVGELDGWFGTTRRLFAAAGLKVRK
jgi:hypothetical protein